MKGYLCFFYFYYGGFTLCSMVVRRGSQHGLLSGAKDHSHLIYPLRAEQDLPKFRYLRIARTITRDDWLGGVVRGHTSFTARGVGSRGNILFVSLATKYVLFSMYHL